MWGYAKALLLFTTFTWILTSSPVQAWTENGTPFADSLNDQQNFRMVPDGAGGALFVWEDFRSGNWDVYAQRLNARGEPLWGSASSGVMVCAHVALQKDPDIASDGNGGAYIVWSDDRDGLDIYGQRISPDGVTQWGLNGAPICAEFRNQVDPRIVADGFGGAIVTWTDTRTFQGDIYAHRLTQVGAVWESGGVIVCDNTSDQAMPVLTLLPGADESATRVTIAWEDYRDLGTTARDIYFQRMTLGGVVQWASSGLPVVTDAGNQYGTRIIPGVSGGSILAWEDASGGADSLSILCEFEIFDRYGTAAGWDQRALSFGPRLIPDGAGGAIVAWTRMEMPLFNVHTEYRVDNVDMAGNLQWANAGASPYVYGQVGSARHIPGVAVASDGAGGGVFPFFSNSGRRIRAQRVPVGGTTDLWGPVGLPVSWTQGYKYEIQAIALDSGSVLVAWRDEPDVPTRGSTLYAQRLDVERGTWGCVDPVLQAVEDLPSDEGGLVRLRVARSDHDSVTDSTSFAILNYNVWRRMDSSAKAGLSGVETIAADDYFARVASGDKTEGMRAHPELAAALELPPGDWESLGLYAAYQLSEYNLVVNTRTDSTASSTPWEVFVVTAHTPDPTVSFISEPDSGYSVDNLAPGILQGLAGVASFDPVGLDITWQAAPESDLSRYAVYRADFPGFPLDEAYLVATPSTSSWFDDTWTAGAGFHYQVAAVDRHDNVGPSAALSPTGVSGVGAGNLPRSTSLAQNHPNPFNPSTTVSFETAAASRVLLAVYDTAGRLVATLIDEHRGAGRYDAVWNGRDIAGREVSAGVYLYRLKVGDHVETRRMTLVK